MRMKMLVLGVALAASAWTPPGFAGTPGQNNFGPFPDLGPIGNGRRIFLEYNCSGCHGGNATGGDMGADISGGVSVDGVYNAVMRGEPYGGMPSFAQYLTYNDVLSIVAYLNNFPSAGGTQPQPTWSAWWQPHPKW
jgi:mono/diheme cytochrome c family protein